MQAQKKKGKEVVVESEKEEVDSEMEEIEGPTPVMKL